VIHCSEIILNLHIQFHIDKPLHSLCVLLQFMTNELMIHTFTYTDAVQSKTKRITIFQVLSETLRISFTDGTKTACKCFFLLKFLFISRFKNIIYIHLVHP